MEAVAERPNGRRVFQGPCKPAEPPPPLAETPLGKSWLASGGVAPALAALASRAPDSLADGESAGLLRAVRAWWTTNPARRARG